MSKTPSKTTKADQPKTPVYKRWWFWVIIVCVAAIAIGAASQGNKATKVEETDSTTSSSTSTDATSTVFNAGDVISYEGMEIAVTDVVRNYVFPEDAYVVDAATGKEYVKVTVSITNNTDSKISYNVYDWEIQDSTGDIQTINGYVYSLDNGLSSGELAAGGTKTGDLLFEVPLDDTGLILHYSANILSDETLQIKL